MGAGPAKRGAGAVFFAFLTGFRCVCVGGGILGVGVVFLAGVGSRGWGGVGLRSSRAQPAAWFRVFEG